MTDADEIELHRLCDMLGTIDRTLDRSSPFREALKKAGLALIHGFIDGRRGEIERQYQQLGTPLSDSERMRLRTLGIDPDAPLSTG